MSTITIDLPKAAREKIERVAQEQGVSLEDFVLNAATDKATAVDSIASLRDRVSDASREAFDRVMAAVPDVDPPEADRVDS